MNFEELKNNLVSDFKGKVGELENAEELITAFNESIDKLSEASIETYRSKNKEAVKYKEIIKSLGYNADDYDSLEDFKAKTKEMLDESNNSKTELEKLQDQFNNLKSEYESERQKRLEKELEAKNNKIKSTLNEKLGNKLYGAKYLINDLVNNGAFELDESGKVISKDGLPFDAKIEKILEENKDDLKEDKKHTPGRVKETRVSGGSSLKDMLKQEMENIKKGTPSNIGIKDA